MKKLFTGIIILLSLTGCFKEKVKLTTVEYKKEIVGKVYKQDEKALKEYKEIMSKLNEQLEKGDGEAEKEISKWIEVENDLKAKNMIKMNSETEKKAEEMIKSGKLW